MFLWLLWVWNIWGWFFLFFLSCLSLFTLGVLLVTCLGWFFVVEFLGDCFLDCMGFGWVFVCYLFFFKLLIWDRGSMYPCLLRCDKNLTLVLLAAAEWLLWDSLNVLEAEFTIVEHYWNKTTFHILYLTSKLLIENKGKNTIYLNGRKQQMLLLFWIWSSFHFQCS